MGYLYQWILQIGVVIVHFYLWKLATSNEPGLVNTARRLIDVTYRINAGILTAAGQKLKYITDKENWVGNFCEIRY